MAPSLRVTSEYAPSALAPEAAMKGGQFLAQSS